MKRYAFILIVLYLYTFFGTVTSASFSDDIGINKEVNDITIKINSFEINEKKLILQYEITNDSQQDIWICDRTDAKETENSIIFLAGDKQTLTIRKCLLSLAVLDIPDGVFVRLPANQNRKESLFISLPFPVNILSMPGKQTQDTFTAKRLFINVGYFQGDLPEMLLKYLEEESFESYKMLRIFRPIPWKSLFFSSFHFNNNNEQLTQSNEEIVIPPEYKSFHRERLLQAVIDDLSIPCIIRPNTPNPREIPPDFLSNSTRIEVRYEPSMLEYYFQYPSQKSFLSREEIEYLQSEKIIIVKNKEIIKGFADEIQKEAISIGVPGDIFSCTNRANINCYRDNDLLTSIIVYDNTLIETEKNKKFRYPRGLQSMCSLTPQIRQLVYREQCVTNLGNLWYRLRFYNRLKAMRENNESLMYEKIYPSPAQWCDDMLQILHIQRDGRPSTSVVKMNEKPYICPSAGEGKCHYAMNSNCVPNSPGDMVLLFETKSGWNQHGGPELFTFDNHDPRGGCVLLNDGTVKFIRTEDALQKLKWK